jgi:hypothetical protein
MAFFCRVPWTHRGSLDFLRLARSRPRSAFKVQQHARLPERAAISRGVRPARFSGSFARSTALVTAEGRRRMGGFSGLRSLRNLRMRMLFLAA